MEIILNLHKDWVLTVWLIVKIVEKYLKLQLLLPADAVFIASLDKISKQDGIYPNIKSLEIIYLLFGNQKT